MSNVYVVLSSLDAVGSVDAARVPNADLSAVLEPTCLSTFTAANGVSLDAITPECGGAWTEHTAVWDIQSNKARHVSSGGDEVATVDAGLSDGMIDCTVDPADVHGYCGIALRYSDDENYWLARWRQGTGDDVELYEQNANSWTLRASTALVGNGQAYDIRAIMDGQTIDVFVDGGNKISYGSATFNQTLTEHGMRGHNTETGSTFDNWAFYPCTAAVYDATFDAV